MSEKIKDGFTGGIYPDGNEFELFAPANGRLGVTGKFNALIDEVGQITNLTTTDKTNVINAVNEIKTKADASVKLNSTPQNLVGTYTFGTTTGTTDKVLFKHDVEFQGTVQFNSGSGDTLAITNNYLSLGSDTSVTPVGDGGVIFERGLGLQDARVYWDESTDEWKIKPGTAIAYPILHTGVTNSNGLNYLLNGVLSTHNINLSGYLRTTKASSSLNGKIWEIKNSSASEDLIIGGISDDTLTSYEAVRILRSGANINGIRFTTTGSTRLTIDTTNITSTLPIKVNSIIENSNDNGVFVDSLTIKDEGILNSTTRLVNFLNTGSLFNPNSSDLDFTVNGNGTQALFIDAGTSQIYNRYNTYLDQTLFVDTITQRSSNGVTFNSIGNFPNNINVTNVQPTITFNESDQATDTKIWNVRGISGTFRVNAVNDANNSVKPAYSISKVTNSPSIHDFYIGDNIHLKLTSNKLDIGSSILDASTQANIVSKDGFNSTLYLRQGSSVKGGIEYIDSTNLFKIVRFADIGGGYVGGIEISETSINTRLLPLVVEVSLATNTINPFSGTVTTINQNLDVTGNLSTANNRLIFGTNASIVDRLEFNDTTNEFTFIEDSSVNNATIVSGRTKLTNTTSPLNTKSTLTSINSSGEYVIASISDDGISTSNIFKNTKNGINTTNQSFYINNVIELSLSNTSFIYGSGANNNNITYNINSKNGYNPILSFTQETTTKGSIEYVDSTNLFSISRYADTGGSYLGGLVLSETNILVDNLSFDVENTLKVNTILEYTNNSGVTIDGVLLKDNSITTNNGNINLGTGSLYFTADDYIQYNDTTNTYFFISDNTTNTNIEVGAITTKSNLFINLDNDNSSSNDRFAIVNSSNQEVARIYETGVLEVSTALRGIDDTFISSIKSNTILFGNTTQGITSDVDGLKIYQNTSDTTATFINSNGDVIVNIDSNNNNIDKSFFIKNNASNTTGNNLFSVNENGLVSTHNGGIHIGTGTLSFNSVNSDYIGFNDTTNTFSFVADGSVNNSIVQVDTLDVNKITSLNGQVASAWVTFNGQDTPTILNSYNVSSITRVSGASHGDYLVNFTSTLPNNTYAFAVTTNASGVFNSYYISSSVCYDPTTTSINIKVMGDNGNVWFNIDPSIVSLVIFCKQ